MTSFLSLQEIRVLKKVILDNMVRMHEKVIFDIANGNFSEASTHADAAGHFATFPDSGVWGLFYTGGSYYFFHNTALYNLDEGKYEIDVDIISNSDARFSLSEKGIVLETLVYEREHGDDWRDEDEVDLFLYVKELLKNRTSDLLIAKKS